MKKLVCIVPFGNFQPGDELDVDAEAVYDKTYFTEKTKSKGGDK